MSASDITLSDMLIMIMWMYAISDTLLQIFSLMCYQYILYLLTHIYELCILCLESTISFLI